MGPEDPNNSLNLLLEWMTTEGNYAHFCGNAEGKTKLKICKEVASLLKEKGVRVERSKKNIFDKIQALEKMFKVAHEWAGQTGQGIDISKQAFDVAVSNRCHYYFCLLPVMGNCSGFKALATTYDIINNDINNSFGIGDNFSESDKDMETNKRDNSNTNIESSQQSGPFSVPFSVITTRPAYSTPVCCDDSMSLSATTQTSLASSKKRKKTQTKNSNAVNKFMFAHETFLDKIESMKTTNVNNIEENSTTSWKSKLDEIDFKLKCVKTYNELKKEGWKNEKIEQKFPKLKGFYQSDDNNEQAK